MRFKPFVSHVGVSFIDRYNINRAIEFGVFRLYQKCRKAISNRGLISLILLDGNYRFAFSGFNVKENMPPVKTIVKGDEKLFTIACASIIAKVRRDEMLQNTSPKYAKYGLYQNKGYGTKKHIEAIRKFGVSRLHRKSFLKNIGHR